MNAATEVMEQLRKALEELAEANARRADLRTALEWANEERDRLREQLAAKHSECPDCADYAARSGRFAEQADRLQRERDEAKARVIDAALIHAELVRERDEARAEVSTAARYCDELAETIRMHVAREIELEAEVERLRGGFRRGAEAMREACIGSACAFVMEYPSYCDDHGDELDAILRALPIPGEA